MKVLFDHPNPFMLAHGGFQNQIEQTKKAPERIGNGFLVKDARIGLFCNRIGFKRPEK